MATKLFVNLAVKDLKRTKDFFAKLGFTFNPHFSDENALCMIINDDSSIMLLKEEFFETFTTKEIANAHNSTEVLTALSVESKEKVNDMMKLALSMGATETNEAQDHGFMFGRSFNDLDGHIWEVIWMDLDAFVIAQQNAAAAASKK